MDSLPNDLVNDLKNKIQFHYNSDGCECGSVTLKSYEELEIGRVRLNAGETIEEEIYIEIPAISILKDCEGYDPDYILLWLPKEEMFGTWDCYHGMLKVFPNTNWKQLLLEPKKYLNAQWYDYNNKYSRDYSPTKNYKKCRGVPHN